MARILVVDDEEMVRFTLRTALEMDSHEVEEAENGLQALELVRNGKFDLVVTDIVMPEKEGMQTILDIKEEFPSMKIIAITGGDPQRNSLYAHTASVLGADKVLLKPFLDEEFLELVGDCLLVA